MKKVRFEVRWMRLIREDGRSKGSNQDEEMRCFMVGIL